jgi:HEAT repeats
MKTPSYTAEYIEHLITTARHDLNPDDRLAAVQLLAQDVISVQDMAKLLRELLQTDNDKDVLWPYAGLLANRYGEYKQARTALIGRLKHDPNPAVRTTILLLLPSHFGHSHDVLAAVAHAADHDPDDGVRKIADQAFAQLEELRYNPPPTWTSYSTRQLATWMND